MSSFNSEVYGNRGDDRRERDQHRGDRYRKRSRSRSRSNSRDRRRRDRDHDDRGDRGNSHYRGSHSNHYEPRVAEPSSTIVVKGLAAHTTESTLRAIIGPYYSKEIRLVMNRDGECKGFAFVEFVSLEYAQYFMTAFAGSAGDPRAAQLIVENRAVQIEYAREQTNSASANSNSGHSAAKADWLCEACACHNFARREACFRCQLPRSERSALVSASTSASASAMNGGGAGSSEAFGDSMVATDTPCAVLVAKGFPGQIVEAQLEELFRQFALVQQVTLLRDPQPPHIVTLAYIHFHGAEHASYALQCALPVLQRDQPQVRLAFARETVMHQLFASYVLQQQQLQQQQQHLQSMYPYGSQSNNSNSHNMVATALQAAQWSMNNGYGTTATTTTTATTSSTMTPSSPGAAEAPISATSVPSAPVVVFPPPFETYGTAYIFQPRSGYFLEPRSDFYYCPKARLYYHARDGVYYSHAQGIFRRYEVPLPTEPYVNQSVPVGAENTAASAADSGEGAQKRMENASNDSTAADSHESSAPATVVPTKLSMTLSTNKSKLNKGGAANGTVTLVSGGKKALQDIAKWGAVQRAQEEEEEARELAAAKKAKGDADEEEKKKQKLAQSQQPSSAPSVTISPASVGLAAVPSATTSSPATNSASAQTSSSASTGKSSSATSASTHVCLLCRRQFTSADMLARHERESKLHAENLAKQQLEQQQQSQIQQPQYRDRATERRELFGSSADHLRPVSAPVHSNLPPLPLASSSALEATSVSATSGTLNVGDAMAADVALSAAHPSNPGVQLLRRLGWAEGQGLGKEGHEGRAVAVGVELAQQQQQQLHGMQAPSMMQSTLRATQGSAVTSTGSRTGGVAGGLEAMRARYEQVSNNPIYQQAMGTGTGQQTNKQ